VSAQPGLIPQMAGFLTNERLWGTTTFVDHVSDFVYVHLMKNFTLEETLKAKRAYEKLLHDAGHTAKHYRAPDNGRFADNGFHKDITIMIKSIGCIQEGPNGGRWSTRCRLKWHRLILCT